jgi:hypothetical protein
MERDRSLPPSFEPASNAHNPPPHEHRYTALMGAMRDGFCIVEMLWDEDGAPLDYRFLEANAVFAEQMGVQAVVARTARELLRISSSTGSRRMDE